MRRIAKPEESDRPGADQTGRASTTKKEERRRPETTTTKSTRAETRERGIDGWVRWWMEHRWRGVEEIVKVPGGFSLVRRQE